MKGFILLLYFTHFICCAQKDSISLPPVSEMVSMNNANVKYGGLYGQQYYANGSHIPFTGFLCARYDNGQFESVQQFKDGIGNGVWINYNPDGSKESQGTYVNNKTEGPATLFYEDGSIKATGNYVHLKNKVGLWTFYDREGNVVSKRYFTR
jgi:antitoxin component YwqK of YwqJK toxin-antitoxin module